MYILRKKLRKLCVGTCLLELNVSISTPLESKPHLACIYDSIKLRTPLPPTKTCTQAHSCMLNKVYRKKGGKSQN